MDLRIHLFQYNMIWENPAANRAKLDNLLASLSEKGDLAVFPEMFNTGFTMNAEKMAENMDGPTIGRFPKESKHVRGNQDRWQAVSRRPR